MDVNRRGNAIDRPTYRSKNQKMKERFGNRIRAKKIKW